MTKPGANLKAEIGARVKRARIALGLTQNALGKLIGKPLSSLRDYETGASIPGGEALAGFVHAGVNVCWLLTGTGEMMLSPDQCVIYRTIPANSPDGALLSHPLKNKFNVENLCMAFAGIAEAAPPGQTHMETARRAIEFYMYMLEKGIVPLAGANTSDME